MLKQPPRQAGSTSGLSTADLVVEVRASTRSSGPKLQHLHVRAAHNLHHVPAHALDISCCSRWGMETHGLTTVFSCPCCHWQIPTHVSMRDAKRQILTLRHALISRGNQQPSPATPAPPQRPWIRPRQARCSGSQALSAPGWSWVDAESSNNSGKPGKPPCLRWLCDQELFAPLRSPSST